MDVQTLRESFPEFANVTDYTDATINMWLTVGVARLNAPRWADLLDMGLMLFACHNLALGRASQKAAAFGGAVGQNTGPLSAKAVDKVNATYDTSAASLEGEGHWNLTTYGTRFVELRNLVGMGGFYVNAGIAPYPPGLAQI